MSQTTCENMNYSRPDQLVRMLLVASMVAAVWSGCRFVARSPVWPCPMYHNESHEITKTTKVIITQYYRERSLLLQQGIYYSKQSTTRVVYLQVL